MAGALLAVWLLLPSGPSMLFGSRDIEWIPRTAVAARREAVASALSEARRELDQRAVEALIDKAVRPALARGDDPVVFSIESNGPSMRRVMEARALARLNHLRRQQVVLPAIRAVDVHQAHVGGQLEAVAAADAAKAVDSTLAWRRRLH